MQYLIKINIKGLLFLVNLFWDYLILQPKKKRLIQSSCHGFL